MGLWASQIRNLESWACKRSVNKPWLQERNPRNSGPNLDAAKGEKEGIRAWCLAHPSPSRRDNC